MGTTNSRACQPASSAPPIVVDCVIVNNEIEQLEWRLSEHDSFVSHFIIIESNVSHTGLPKTAYVRRAWRRFRPWHHKMQLITLGEAPPTVLADPDFRSHVQTLNRKINAMTPKHKAHLWPGSAVPHLDSEPMARERWARTVALRHVKQMLADAKLPAHAFVSVASDADEIYERNTFLREVACIAPGSFVIPQYSMHYYHLNCVSHAGSRLARGTAAHNDRTR
jgi:hypothetical protein